jgi:hypothetical protein
LYSIIYDIIKFLIINIVVSEVIVGVVCGGEETGLRGGRGRSCGFIIFK